MDADSDRRLGRVEHTRRYSESSTWLHRTGQSSLAASEVSHVLRAWEHVAFTHDSAIETFARFDQLNKHPLSLEVVMNGSSELAQLAHLLRACAETARNIAWLRPKDAHLLLPMSRQANDMAADVDLIVAPLDVRRR